VAFACGQASNFPVSQGKAEVNGKLDGGTDICPGRLCSSQTSPPCSPGCGATQHMQGPSSSWGVITRWELVVWSQGQKSPGLVPILCSYVLLF